MQQGESAEVSPNPVERRVQGECRCVAPGGTQGVAAGQSGARWKRSAKANCDGQQVCGNLVLGAEMLETKQALVNAA